MHARIQCRIQVALHAEHVAKNGYARARSRRVLPYFAEIVVFDLDDPSHTHIGGDLSQTLLNVGADTGPKAAVVSLHRQLHRGRGGRYISNAKDGRIF